MTGARPGGDLSDASARIAELRREGVRGVLLAVSGGSDSMALMHLAAPAAAPDFKVHVGIVDHGLRAESRAEALWVVDAAARLGLPAAVLAWTGEKPASGIVEAARNARYRLLAAHADASGLDAILLGHTADDVAETLLMRLARGSGLAGLAAMAPASQVAAGARAPVRLLRPLLQCRRSCLRDWLKSIPQEFVDDPGNTDDRFERARIRTFLSGEAAQGAGLESGALARAAMRLRNVADERATTLGARFRLCGGVFFHWGGARLALESLDDDRDAGLVARLIHAVSGEDHPPDAAAASEVLAQALGGRAASLGGAIIEPSVGELFFFREGAALCGRSGVSPVAAALVPPGKRLLWDNRFIISNNDPEEPMQIRPLGNAAPSEFPLFQGPARALAALPGIHRGAALSATPAWGAAGPWRALTEERFAGAIRRF